MPTQQRAFRCALLAQERCIIMVALNVEAWGDVRPICEARPILFQAQDAYERGDLIACGCLLREAFRKYLVAECEARQCLPKKRKQQSPTQLLRLLKKLGHVDSDTAKWYSEIITTGNAAAHCDNVENCCLKGCMSIMHIILDSATNLDEPNNLRNEGGVQ